MKTENIDNLKTIRVPYLIFSNQNKEISSQDKFILLVLLIFENEENISKLTLSDIYRIMFPLNQKTKIATQNISKSIKMLQTKEFIEVSKERQYETDNVEFGYYTNTYKINENKLSSKDEAWVVFPYCLITEISLSWQQRLFALQLQSLYQLNEIRPNFPKTLISKKMGLSYPTFCSRLDEITNIPSKGVLKVINSQAH